jgi:hypothetical protein
LCCFVTYAGTLTTHSSSERDRFSASSPNPCCQYQDVSEILRAFSEETNKRTLIEAVYLSELAFNAGNRIKELLLKLDLEV